MKVCIEYGLGKNSLLDDFSKINFDKLGNSVKNSLIRNGFDVIDITSRISTMDLELEEQRVVLLANSVGADFLISLRLDSDLEGAYCYSNSEVGNRISKEILLNLEKGYKNKGIFNSYANPLLNKIVMPSVLLNLLNGNNHLEMAKLNKGEFDYEFVARAISKAVKENLE